MHRAGLGNHRSPTEWSTNHSLAAAYPESRARGLLFWQKVFEPIHFRAVYRRMGLKRIIWAQKEPKRKGGNNWIACGRGQ
jgi:hypothetical protein